MSRFDETKHPRRGDGKFTVKRHGEPDDLDLGDDGPARIYTTLDDLVAVEVAPAFGDYADDFDVDGLVRGLRDADLIRYVDHPGAAQRNGFQLVAGADEFWELAARFDRVDDATGATARPTRPGDDE